jgi:hypothetical protein
MIIALYICIIERFKNCKSSRLCPSIRFDVTDTIYFIPFGLLLFWISETDPEAAYECNATNYCKFYYTTEYLYNLIVVTKLIGFRILATAAAGRTTVRCPFLLKEPHQHPRWVFTSCWLPHSLLINYWMVNFHSNTCTAWVYTGIAYYEVPVYFRTLAF